MIYSYRLPFIGVTGTPIDTPPVVIDYLPRESVFRVRTKNAGTFELTPKEFADLGTLLTASDQTKRVVNQLEKYDRKAILALLEEPTNDLELLRAVG